MTSAAEVVGAAGDSLPTPHGISAPLGAPAPLNPSGAGGDPGYGLATPLARRVLVTFPVRALSAYPPAAQVMLDRYATRFGGPPSSAYALHGYEAMRLMLDAVAAVGPDRDAIVEWLRAVRNRDSVLGPYNFDAHQDATIRNYGVHRIRAGRFVWEATAVAPE